MTEKSPLPQDFRDVEQNSIVGKASRGENLTHYVLAERMMQVEADLIKQELMDPKDPPNTLIYMLEGGFRGFHKMTGGELWAEWKDGAEDQWYIMYDDKQLPWEIYDEDPLADPEEKTPIFQDARDHHLINKDPGRMIGKKK